jgi:hypothetical protein
MQKKDADFIRKDRKSMFEYSKYQKAVFKFAEESSGNLIVNAVAGAAKTTTAMDLAKNLELYGGRFMAFNRHIRDTLVVKSKEKGITGFDYLTFNGFGNSVLNSQLKYRPKLNENKDRNIFFYKVVGDKAPNDQKKKMFAWCNTIVRLVGLFKYMNLDFVQAQQQLDYITDRHDIDIPEDPQFLDWLFTTYAMSIAEHTIISYTDQVFLPVYLDMNIPQVEILITDEKQDSCVVESELIHRGCRNGRIFAFGDPDQAIYSFKGTTPNAMEHFKTAIGAEELPLSICYRCSKAVVREAQKYVPRIEYADWAKEGEVADVKPEIFAQRAATGDMVLARCTVDLVSSCLRFIREGKQAYVVGREIGKSIEYMIDRLSNGEYISITRIDDFLKALMTYYVMESEKLKNAGAETRLINLDDRVETIKAIAEASDSVMDLKRRVKEIFAEEGGVGIQHMTIHKCKGLECDGDVYLLAPEKIPHKRCKQKHQIEEEYRLLYVAITRAKNNFYYVRSQV